jgi:hypothetical protein
MSAVVRAKLRARVGNAVGKPTPQNFLLLQFQSFNIPPELWLT